MELIKYYITYPAVINNEYRTSKPVLLKWFQEPIVEPKGKVIKVSDHYVIVEMKPKSTDEIEKLNTILGHVRINKGDEPYIALKEYHQPADDKLGIAFLQCVSLGDFTNAKKMLGFEISDKKLREYFGEFEVLNNNYLRDGSVSIVPAGTSTARTYRFEINDNKIINMIQ